MADYKVVGKEMAQQFGNKTPAFFEYNRDGLGMMDATLNGEKMTKLEACNRTMNMKNINNRDERMGYTIIKAGLVFRRTSYCIGQNRAVKDNVVIVTEKKDGLLTSTITYTRLWNELAYMEDRIEGEILDNEEKEIDALEAEKAEIDEKISEIRSRIAKKRSSLKDTRRNLKLIGYALEIEGHHGGVE